MGHSGVEEQELGAELESPTGVQKCTSPISGSAPYRALRGSATH